MLIQRSLVIAIWRIGSLVLGGFVLACLAISLVGIFDDIQHADIAVVLGNKVNRDGRPSEMLKARLDHTITLYREGWFEKVLVSGGCGQEGFDEATVMKRYLVANGVPADSVFEDNQGTTTWNTAKNTSLFLEYHHLHSVLIVTQYFHVVRCRLAFHRQGITPIYYSHAPFFSWRDLWSIPREVIGCAQYFFRRDVR